MQSLRTKIIPSKKEKKEKNKNNILVILQIKDDKIELR